MAKDPCVLVYFDKWISSTNGMSADFRSWYFDLLIYQFDKNGVPNDNDFIAGICRVKPSEYERFKQMLEQVLKQKFMVSSDGLLRNEHMSSVIEKRGAFKIKREKTGTIGQIIKQAKELNILSANKLNEFKEYLFTLEINDIQAYLDKQTLKQTLKQKGKLYINVIEDEDINKDIIKDKEKEAEIFEKFRFSYPGSKGGHKTEFDNFKKKYKNWPELLFLLMPGLDNEKRWRAEKAKANQFIPEWKNLQTWINNRCWEQELGVIGNIEIKKDKLQGMNDLVLSTLNKNKNAQNGESIQPLEIE